MNKEPKIELPPCKEGYRWEYRGTDTGLTYTETCVYSWPVNGVWHYWEAVPAPATTNECRSMGELVRLEAANRAEKIDHTEGGKYRMLEEGEKLEPSDQYFWHDRKEWDSVFGCAGYNRPFSKAFWGSDVRRLVTPQPDFAQQAKDILQARFVTGFPAFREITLDHFVDLIIKATKQ